MVDFEASGEVKDQVTSLALKIESIVLQNNQPKIKKHQASLEERGYPIEELAEVISQKIGAKVTKEELEATEKLRLYAERKHSDVVFENIDDSRLKLQLEYGEEAVVRALDIGEFTVAPLWLRFPSVIVYLWEPDSRIKTPYGESKQYALDRTGRLFLFDERYFLNRFGQACKVLEITTISSGKRDEDALLDSGTKREDVSILEEAVDSEERIITPLTTTETNEIQEYVKQIIQGKWRKVQ